MTEIIKTLDQNQDKKISQDEIKDVAKLFQEKPESKDKLASHLDQDDNKTELVNKLKEGEADKAINGFLQSPEGLKLLKEFNPQDPKAQEHPAFLFAKTLAYMENANATAQNTTETTGEVKTEATEKVPSNSLNDKAMEIALTQKVEKTVTVDNSGATNLIVGERNINVADKSVTFPLEVNNNGALQNLVTEGAEITLSFNDKGKLQVPEDNTMTKLKDGSLFVRYHLPDGKWQDAKLSVSPNNISLSSIDHTVEGAKIHDTFLEDEKDTHIENALTPIKNTDYPEARYAVKVTRGGDTNYMLLNADKNPISAYTTNTPFAIGNTGFPSTNEGANIESGIRIDEKGIKGLDKGTTEIARETTKGIKGMPDGYSMNFSADGGFDIGKIDGAKYNKMHITPQQAENIKAGKGVLYLGDNAYNLSKLDKSNKDAEVTKNTELSDLLAQRDKQVIDQFNSPELWTTRPEGLDISVKSEIADGIYNTNNEALNKAKQEITLESNGVTIPESNGLVKFENGLFSLTQKDVIINHNGSLRKIALNTKQESINAKGEQVSKGLYFNELKDEEAGDYLQAKAGETLTTAKLDSDLASKALTGFIDNPLQALETAIANPSALIPEAKADNVSQNGINLESIDANGNENVIISVDNKGNVESIMVKGTKLDASGNAVDAQQKFMLKDGVITPEGGQKGPEQQAQSRQDYMNSLIAQGFTVKDVINTNGDMQKDENSASLEGFKVNLGGGKKVENGITATNDKGETKHIYNTGSTESPTRKLFDVTTHKNLQSLTGITGLSTKLDDSGAITVEHTYADKSLDNMKNAFALLELSPTQSAEKAKMEKVTSANTATIESNTQKIAKLESSKAQFAEDPDSLKNIESTITSLTKSNETLANTNKNLESTFYSSLITPENGSLLNKVDSYTLKDGTLNKADGTTTDKITVNGVEYTMKEGVLTGPASVVTKPVETQATTVNTKETPVPTVVQTEKSTEKATNKAVETKPTTGAPAKVDATVKTETTTTKAEAPVKIIEKTTETNKEGTKEKAVDTKTVTFKPREQTEKPGVFKIYIDKPLTLANGKTTDYLIIEPNGTFGETIKMKIYHEVGYALAAIDKDSQNYRVDGPKGSLTYISFIKDQKGDIIGIRNNGTTDSSEGQQQLKVKVQAEVNIQDAKKTEVITAGNTPSTTTTETAKASVETQAPEKTDNGLATMKNNINTWTDVSGTKQKLLNLVSLTAGVSKLDAFNQLFANTDLKAVQKQLGTPDDGILGPRTYSKMVEKLQQGLGVNTDGLLGEQTYAALTKESKNQTANLDAIANYNKSKSTVTESPKTVTVANKTAAETTSKNINVAPIKPKEPTPQELYKEREKTATTAIQDWLGILNAVDVSYPPTQRNIGNKIMTSMPANFMKRNEKPQDPLAMVNITSNGDIQVDMTDNYRGISALPKQTISMAEIKYQGGDIAKAYRTKVQKNK